jgi:hypothetical protein
LPQDPHGLGIAAPAGSVTAVVANTDSCFSNCTEPQAGQAGTVSLRTKVSNCFPQS